MESKQRWLLVTASIAALGVWSTFGALYYKRHGTPSSLRALLLPAPESVSIAIAPPVAAPKAPAVPAERAPEGGVALGTKPAAAARPAAAPAVDDSAASEHPTTAAKAAVPERTRAEEAAAARTRAAEEAAAAKAAAAKQPQRAARPRQAGERPPGKKRPIDEGF
jgi:hypothetical protein